MIGLSWWGKAVVKLPKAEVAAELCRWKFMLNDVSWVLGQWLEHAPKVVAPQVKDKRPMTRAALLEQERPRKRTRK